VGFRAGFSFSESRVNKPSSLSTANVIRCIIFQFRSTIPSQRLEDVGTGLGRRYIAPCSAYGWLPEDRV
jgi:hypothetical protein